MVDALCEIRMLPNRTAGASDLHTCYFPAMKLSRLLAALCLCPLLASAAEPASVTFGFEEPALGAAWKTEGDVSVNSGDAYADGRALKLFRAPERTHLPVSAAGPAFAVRPGFWDLSVAGKVDIYSPDNSFNGKVWLEVLGEDGKVIDRLPVGDFDRQKNWTPLSRRVELPTGSAQARFFIEMNKAHGTFLVDGLTAAYRGAGRQETETVDRILFSTAQLGNLLYPDDPRTVKIEVETFRPLPDHLRTVTVIVRDYWGVEQAAPLLAPLTPRSDTSYEAQVDLSAVPLEVGKYYELHASVDQPQGRPAENHTSLAILPEAPNKKHPPAEIPFTSRNWDNRIEEFYPLTDRLGIRICGIWGRFTAEPPYEAQAQRIDLVKKLGLGALTTTPIANIEHQRPGWEKFDEKALREGTRNLIEKIGDVRPLVINLGNEPPHHDREVIKRDVAAYKIVYDEIKKIDPTIFVLGSSAGPQEEFFELGFGEWCDAYDFHTYDDPAAVRSALRSYRELFKKYGHPKPVWSTEIGLNSQGLERRAVSVDMIKKITGFFAEGGANVSWFGLLYPDRNLKLTGGSEDAHNVFDCRYARYAPKLDALTYYFVGNGIGIKKFVAEKTYPNGVYAALFRDRDGRCLQALWKEDETVDVFVPLAGAQNVRGIRIDGSTRVLEAGGKGVTLSIGPDPVLLEYESSEGALAAALDEPAAVFDGLDQPLVLGRPSVATFTPRGEKVSVTLRPPPLWKTDSQGAKFQITPPSISRVREAVLSAAVTNADGRVTGDLERRLPVSGKLSLRLLPEPAATDGEPGVRIFLTNNGATPLNAQWDAALTGERILENGAFGLPKPSDLGLGGERAGSVSLQPGETKTIVLPLAGADPARLYRIRATASEADGGTLTAERYVGGFVGVPRVATPPTLDGTLTDPAWQTAPAVVIDQGNHFCPLRKTTASWSGAADLSAKARFLWDDKYLYLGVEVQDDKAGALKADEPIWAQDGLQFLVDPARESTVKPGKYDYAVALGAKGPQAWCYLTADPIQAPVREATDIRVSAKRTDEKTGSITYEVAIPWHRVAPFQPRAGANLGFTLIFNEDDGQGRDSFLAWFGNAHTKQVDTAGDLILLPSPKP
jgi:hypothetical protein